MWKWAYPTPTDGNDALLLLAKSLESRRTEVEVVGLALGAHVDDLDGDRSLVIADLELVAADYVGVFTWVIIGEVPTKGFPRYPGKSDDVVFLGPVPAA